MKKLVGALAISGALLTPLATKAADDHDRDHHRVTTYYDSDRHDRHEWNEQEDRAYRHWLEEERHERYRDWKHAGRARQREYWRWRHEHSDWR